ncbi:unnamed protein product [Calypogeia fissa]
MPHMGQPDILWRFLRISCSKYMHAVVRTQIQISAKEKLDPSPLPTSRAISLSSSIGVYGNISLNANSLSLTASVDLRQSAISVSLHLDRRLRWWWCGWS